MKKILANLAILAFVLSPVSALTPAVALADTNTIDFEGYTLGSINGQSGWSSTGSYDQAVVANSYGYTSFGTKAFRISNSVTSGAFGDQTFSASLANEAGESSAVSNGYSGGIRQPHFEAQFDIAPTQPTEQPGLSISVSPDRGDGARMSYLRFVDQSGGVHVFFDDVTDSGPVATTATFNETDIATLTRAPHTIKFSMDFVNGASNDVVKIYIDNVLVKTGTSWEDYYRYDPEQTPSGNQVPTVDSLLIRAGGTAVPANAGNGYLFDNITLTSGTPDTTAPAVPTNISPLNNSILTQAQLTMIDWSDVTDPSSPVVYYYESSNSNSTNPNGSFTAPAYQSGALSASQIPTFGTPEGEWYWHVRAVDSVGNSSAWSPVWHITVDNTPVVPPTVPTNMNECKNNGWKSFSTPTFKNQGQCVSYVQANDHAGKK